MAQRTVIPGKSKPMTYSEERLKVLGRRKSYAPCVREDSAQRLGPKRQLGDCRKQAKDALPLPAEITLRAGAAVCPVLDVPRGPGEHHGPKTLDGDDVHPLL